MMKLPHVAGIIFCEQIAIDPSVGRMDLRGLCRRLQFGTFPTPAQQFTVYAALYDGVGEGTIQLDCMQLETEKTIYIYQRWLRFPGRQFWVDLEVRVKKCVFPAPGRYEFALRFDSHELARRYLDVLQD